ncbi:gamma-cysteine synthetase regulatory subunit, putative [Talaromyces stipitatus ATCC 10500]|uniref:GCS light chain n=1 Tax=Talaromyces stipitatus (strain ATCC 10500 / CBS 375.48 / QM 6759 / NRRL 1006) TaxID=441959 RepID=B8M5A3_TALSN|nr:gamma-cysteine synthetase regulatory subunit, putative [Talaromyces stipitatus ATCC 10500]EED19709.1 gamma-cysteine synthetase regulatory subunit, putative [Talaromyces stipitatus ATCC 10500]
MKLLLSTSNIMTTGPSVVRFHAEKSNVELINSLKSNFQAAQQSLPPQDEQSNKKPWTKQEGDTLYVPATDFALSGLSEERDQYDITVKLFYLPGIPASRRQAHTRDAIDLVLKELHVETIDLLIVSFPGVSFDAEDEETEANDEDEERSRTGSESKAGSECTEQADDFESMVKTWHTLEMLVEEGKIAQLGVAEFGTERLARFLQQTRIRPSVDQINVKDCCVVPKSLILYAKQEKIRLLTHNDCTNILPPGTTRELLGSGNDGAGILASAPDAGDGLQGDIEPQWVVKYTTVVKDRGVIENKGYFALAELGNCIQTNDRS